MHEQYVQIVGSIRKHCCLIASTWTAREHESYVFVVLPLFHLSIKKSAFGTPFGCKGVGLINKCVFLCRQLQNAGVLCSKFLLEDLRNFFFLTDMSGVKIYFYTPSQYVGC